MIPIFYHEYTITTWGKKQMGVQQIVVTIVTESKESQDMQAMVEALNYFDQNLNISHKILLEGYKKNE